MTEGRKKITLELAWPEELSQFIPRFTSLIYLRFDSLLLTAIFFSINHMGCSKV